MPNRADSAHHAGFDVFRGGDYGRYLDCTLPVALPVLTAPVLRKTPLLWVVSFTTIFYVDSFKTPAPEIGVVTPWRIDVSLSYEKVYDRRNQAGIRPEKPELPETPVVVIHILCGFPHPLWLSTCRSGR